MFFDNLKSFNKDFDSYCDILRKYNNEIDANLRKEEELGGTPIDAGCYTSEKLGYLSCIGLLENNKEFSNSKALNNLYYQKVSGSVVERFSNISVHLGDELYAGEQLFILNEKSKFKKENGYKISGDYYDENLFKLTNNWYYAKVYIGYIDEGISKLESFKIFYETLSDKVDEMVSYAQKLIHCLQIMQDNYGGSFSSGFKRILYKLGFSKIYADFKEAYDNLVCHIDDFLTACLKCIAIDYEEEKNLSKSLKRSHKKRFDKIDEKYKENIDKLKCSLQSYGCIYSFIKKLEKVYGTFNSSSEYMSLFNDNLFFKFDSENEFIEACRDLIEKKKKQQEVERHNREVEYALRKQEEAFKKQQDKQRYIARELCMSCKHNIGCTFKNNLSSPICSKFENKY